MSAGTPHTLVIFVTSTRGGSNPALTTVPGFASLSQCMAAGKEAIATFESADGQAVVRCLYLSTPKAGS